MAALISVDGHETKPVHVISYRHQFSYHFHIHLEYPKNLIQYIFGPIKKLSLRTNLKRSFHLSMRSIEGKVISKSEDYINISCTVLGALSTRD